MQAQAETREGSKGSYGTFLQVTLRLQGIEHVVQWHSPAFLKGKKMKKERAKPKEATRS